MPNAPRWRTRGPASQPTSGHCRRGAKGGPSRTPLDTSSPQPSRPRSNFYKELAAAGFRFNVFTDRGARRLGTLSPAELIDRLRARTATTNRPPAPVVAMLGEIVVHGEDIRRPLGLRHQYAEGALVAVADNYTKTNLLIGSKRRIAGLRLRATDCEWAHGEGPDVNGPLASLILAMAGRSRRARRPRWRWTRDPQNAKLKRLARKAFA